MKCLGMLYWEDLSAGFGTMRPREPIKLFIYIFFSHIDSVTAVVDAF